MEDQVKLSLFYLISEHHVLVPFTLCWYTWQESLDIKVNSRLQNKFEFSNKKLLARLHCIYKWKASPQRPILIVLRQYGFSLAAY